MRIYNLSNREVELFKEMVKFMMTRTSNLEKSIIKNFLIKLYSILNIEKKLNERNTQVRKLEEQVEKL